MSSPPVSCAEPSVGTDHLMVRSKLLISIQPRGPRTAPNKILNRTALNTTPPPKTTFDGLLAENLYKIPEESANWPALRQAFIAQP
ncbi:hypothetical protein N1851_023508 [Merluccius polli]|uniref:Uncharacterized protein n=1 Tax=Merluccius polli TaxID=89951 RepID=A0AA47MFZ7_MERPO|nr:hypothetical protein N1851_023508 [Merluccius polli]